jgi:hypothetical protein
MKTGTPVRIDGRSVDFSTMEEQKSENDFHKFSYLPSVKRELKQRSCWITYTSESVHEALREGLKDSPLYNGQIKSIGPRYCPSIETKIVTFAQKTSHQLFLEPEGENTNEYYLNGFSSSLPLQIQLKALQRIPAFKNVHIFRPGYAIEYDFFDPKCASARKYIFFPGTIRYILIFYAGREKYRIVLHHPQLQPGFIAHHRLIPGWIKGKIYLYLIHFGNGFNLHLYIRKNKIGKRASG